MRVKHSINKQYDRFSQIDRVIYGGAGLLLFFTVMSGIILAASRAYSDGMAITSTSSTASVNVPAFCSMTATVDSEHYASILGGVYQDNIGQTTIQTFCNDPDGYAIYAIGYTGGDAGVTAGTNTRLHSSALGDDYDISTGTAQSGDTSNWAMKLSAVTTESSGTLQPYAPSILSDGSGSYNAYHTVPAAYAKVASFSSMTDNKGGIGSSLTTTYAAYVSGTQPAGTYTGQVKYVLVHPSSHYNPDTRYMQEVNMWGSSVRVGEEVTAYDTRDNKTYTVARLCMEGYNPSTNACESSMLWMTQNLDLDLSTSTPLNSINTDLNYYTTVSAASTGYSKDANGTIYWTPASTANTIQFEGGSGTTVSGWANSNDAPYSASSYYDSAGNDVYVVSSGSDAADTVTNLAGCTGSGKTAAECEHYNTGNYYNFAAANATNSVAGTVGHTITDADNYKEMPNSVCPAGWRLPHGLLSAPTIGVTSSNNSEFDTLLHTYGITANTGATAGQNVGYASNKGPAIRTNPLYFVRAGYVNGGTLHGEGTDGNSWSNTISATSYGYYLGFYTAFIKPAHSSDRTNGFVVRCIAREEKAIDSVSTMQEFATMSAERKSAVVASMATDHQYQLTDERDSKVYWVSKMKDGKVWMTQALDLDLHNGTVLEHTQSDIGWTENDENKTWNPATSANTIQFEGGSGTTMSGWTNDNDVPYSASPYYSSAGNDVYIMSSGNDNDDTATNLTGCTSTGKSTAECAHYKVGNYYNFAAANATNSVVSTVGHTVTDADNYTIMPDSICPAGWRMPHGLLAAATNGVSSPNNSEFDTLLYAYGITPTTGVTKNQNIGFASGKGPALRVGPLYFVRSGYVANRLSGRATSGHSWSNTIGGAFGGYYLNFYAVYMGPTDGNAMFYGFPVRCILR